jgi:diguanylate cyclase (GGDEF)-like protein
VRIDEERALAAADLGRWQDAYAALRQQFELQRGLDGRLADDRSARLREQFNAERTEHANRLLAAENATKTTQLAAREREAELQRRVLVLGAVLVVVLAALALRQLLRARRLRRLAMIDDLTGLANRRSILALLDQQLRGARRDDAPVSVVAFDIDHFKRINDTWGHDAGDRALKRIAALARSAVRASDRIGRVGGEEFLAVLPRSSAMVAREIAERVRETTAAADFDEVAPGLRITLSLGVATRVPGESGQKLGKRADEALYRAKQGGRNRVEVAPEAVIDRDA